MSATAYMLRWDNGHSFVLSPARAAELVSEWRSHGCLSGDLGTRDGITFTSDHGGRATIRETIPTPGPPTVRESLVTCLGFEVRYRKTAWDGPGYRGMVLPPKWGRVALVTSTHVTFTGEAYHENDMLPLSEVIFVDCMARDYHAHPEHPAWRDAHGCAQLDHPACRR